MKKLLITGSEGSLASRFIPYYHENYNITAVNHKQLDITNEKNVFDFFKSHTFDYVFHTAAISDTGFVDIILN